MKSEKEKNKVESLTKAREITFSTKSQPSKSATPKTCFVLWGNNVYFFRFLLRHQLVEYPHCLDLVSFSVPTRVDWEKSIMRLSNFNFRSTKTFLAGVEVVCYTAVFSVVTQRSSPKIPLSPSFFNPCHAG